MQWLNTMRLGDGGFISTVDTIVAMEALVTYSYNSRIKDLTDLTVEVDIPDSNLTHPFHITGQNIAKLQRIQIPNVWGHINLVANGAGQAIAQLDVNWGVDYEPFKVTHCMHRPSSHIFAEFNFLSVISGPPVQRLLQPHGQGRLPRPKQVRDRHPDLLCLDTHRGEPHVRHGHAHRRHPFRIYHVAARRQQVSCFLPAAKPAGLVEADSSSFFPS